jgi:hypothetical protein
MNQLPLQILFDQNINRQPEQIRVMFVRNVRPRLLSMPSPAKSIGLHENVAEIDTNAPTVNVDYYEELNADQEPRRSWREDPPFDNNTFGGDDFGGFEVSAAVDEVGSAFQECVESIRASHHLNSSRSKKWY